MQLTERERATVSRIVQAFASRVGEVKVFGSRARGTARPGSDLDLVVFPPAALGDLLALAGAFEESDLPMQVDVLAWDAVQSTALRDEIERSSIPAPGSGGDA